MNLFEFYLLCCVDAPAIVVQEGTIFPLPICCHRLSCCQPSSMFFFSQVNLWLCVCPAMEPFQFVGRAPLFVSRLGGSMADLCISRKFFSTFRDNVGALKEEKIGFSWSYVFTKILPVLPNSPIYQQWGKVIFLRASLFRYLDYLPNKQSGGLLRWRGAGLASYGVLTMGSFQVLQH